MQRDGWRERERDREREIDRERERASERERERFDPLWPVEGYNLTSRNVCT
jgi:hypothetical protein